jgi:hypothetical protein
MALSLNKETQDRLDIALARVQKIDFFPPKSLNEANSLIPQVEKILIDSPNYDWLENTSALTRPRKFAYHNKIFPKVKGTVRKGNEIVKSKLEPKIEEYLNEAGRNDIGGTVFSFLCERKLLGEVSRNISGYILWQPIGGLNPFESRVRLYEIGLRPRGLKNVSELEPKQTPKEHPEIDLFRKIGLIVDKRSLKLSNYDLNTVTKSVVDFPLTGKDVVSPVRFYGGDITFTTPKSLDRTCLGCYAQGDGEIKYTHYWTENCNYNLRPLSMDSVVSFFGDDSPDTETYMEEPPIKYAVRRNIENLPYSSLESVPLSIFLRK